MILAPYRRWSFSLRTLFVVMTVCAILVAMLTSRFLVFVLVAAMLLLGILVFASFFGLAWLVWWITPERDEGRVDGNDDSACTRP